MLKRVLFACIHFILFVTTFFFADLTISTGALKTPVEIFVELLGFPVFTVNRFNFTSMGTFYVLAALNSVIWSFPIYFIYKKTQKSVTES